MKQEMKNKKKMRYVALGDSVAEFYYLNKRYPILLDGGGSRFNAICHLGARGEKTAVIGGVGNDLPGRCALKGFTECNVDTNFIMQKDGNTRTYHIIQTENGHVSQKDCPICGMKKWYEEPMVGISYWKKYVLPTDILILDGLKQENICVLQEFENPKVLDIGRTKRLEALDDKTILDLIQNGNIDILQLNETVEKYLLSRFSLQTDEKLYQHLKPNLLIVTRGRRGADFINSTMAVEKKLYSYTEEVDDTGAGDAFFSVVIQKYYEHNKEISVSWIDETFAEANQLVSKVVSFIGARGYLYEAYVPKCIYHCIC